MTDRHVPTAAAPTSDPSLMDLTGAPTAKGPASASAPVSTRRRDRGHDGPPRTVRVLLRVTRAQFAELDDAARIGGLTVSGYAADAAVAAANGAQPPLSEPLRAALGDLVDARAQLRQLQSNVHLAVTAYHRNATPPSWLRAAVQDIARAVTRVDAAAEAIVRSLR